MGDFCSMKKLIIGMILISKASFALETDQFVASFHVIKDSSSVINDYFYKNINKALDDANRKHPEKIKCQKLADNVLTNLVGKYSISKISKFAKNSPDVDKFPDSSIKDGEYFNMTFYKDVGLLMKLSPPLARTININGIYMGTDKLGHFSLIGRNYYRAYLNNLKKGQSPAEAEKNAIVRGFKTEKGILGYGIGGVLSFGDLEANYEGLRFGIDMCEGENPYFVFVNNRWELNSNNQFDVKTYFNPRMDESFNFSFWRPWLYKKISGKMKKEYCEVRETSLYKERIASYAGRMKENLNDRLIKKYLLSIPKFDRKLEDVENSCSH